MKTKPFKEILKETIQRNCTDDYDGMFLFFESSVIEAHNEYASQFQQEWIPVEEFMAGDFEDDMGEVNLIGTIQMGSKAENLFTESVKWSNGEYLFSKTDEEITGVYKLIAVQPLPQPYNPKQS